MSEQDLSLRALNTEYSRQAMLLEGRLWDGFLEDQARGVATRYCALARKRWNIELTPVVRWEEESARMVLGAEPSSDLDAAMLDELTKRESQHQ